MSDVLDDQINRRFTVLTWAVGITAGPRSPSSRPA